jgi:hypothetical protein
MRGPAAAAASVEAPTSVDESVTTKSERDFRIPLVYRAGGGVGNPVAVGAFARRGLTTQGARAYFGQHG